MNNIKYFNKNKNRRFACFKYYFVLCLLVVN